MRRKCYRRISKFSLLSIIVLRRKVKVHLMVVNHNQVFQQEVASKLTLLMKYATSQNILVL